MTFLGVGTNHDLGTTTPVFHKARVEKNGPSISDIIISHLIKSEIIPIFSDFSDFGILLVPKSAALKKHVIL